MSEELLASWDAAIAPLDERLRPIATRKVDLSNPDWAKSFPKPRQPALDEAGIRPEAESLLRQIVDRYPSFDEPMRQRVREMFHRWRHFAWATTLGFRPTDADTLRKHLVLVSMHDQADDPRDTIVWLDRLCREARDAGVNPGPVLEEVATITSDVDRWRFGSTRRLMLAAASRWAPR